MADSSLPDLLSWLRSVGIWWDEQLVAIRAGCSGCSGPDLGVFAVTDITENQLLCVIPRSAILSPRTSSLAAVLEKERLGGGLALTIAVMHEASLAADSRWSGYFASLPRREYLPLFWTQPELGMLQGTSLEGKALADREDTQDDYDTHVVPLLQKYPEAFPNPEQCSVEHFRTAASWVASRCFFVDDWHGDAMVPLADIFNHKASVVLLGDAWGVAELAAADQHPHSEDGEPSAGAGHSGGVSLDGGEEPGSSSGSGQHEHEHEHEHGHEGSEAHSDSGSEEEEEGSEEEEDEEDAQHGFAVGGMPLIQSAGPAAAADTTADGCTANGHHSSSAAARWVRDGNNLRLEIGICSMGPPDSKTLPAAPTAAIPAAPAAPAEPLLGSPAAASGEAASVAAEEQPAKKRKVHPLEQQQSGQQQGQECQQEVKQAEGSWPEKRLEIVAASSVAAGAEVHNTYGELGNAQLVAKYGFCLPRNPFDEVTLCDTWAEFVSGSSGTAGFKAPAGLKQHVKWLQKHSNLLDESPNEDQEEPDPPAIAPGGRLDLMTAAVVRLLGASTAQLKGWQDLQEVLHDPHADSDSAEPPTAVPLQPAAHTRHTAAAGSESGTAAAIATAAATEGGNPATAEVQDVSQHFEDLKISSRSVSWWGKAGLELLAAAVRRRLQRYPASLADDRLALQRHQQQRVRQQQGAGDAVVAAEHAAAVGAALQLRVCEQEALQEVLEQVELLLLGSS